MSVRSKFERVRSLWNLVCARTREQLKGDTDCYSLDTNNYYPDCIWSKALTDFA